MESLDSSATCPKKAYITCYEKLYDFLTDQTKVIKDFHILDTGIIVMKYVQSKEFQEPDCKTNVIIAFMCSAYAHLKLWKIMNQLGRRVMYHDMDSVIYSSYLGQWKPAIGKYLGDLADELVCQYIRCPGCSAGHWIVEFVSCQCQKLCLEIKYRKGHVQSERIQFEFVGITGSQSQ